MVEGASYYRYFKFVARALDRPLSFVQKRRTKVEKRR